MCSLTRLAGWISSIVLIDATPSSAPRSTQPPSAHRRNARAHRRNSSRRRLQFAHQRRRAAEARRLWVTSAAHQARRTFTPCIHTARSHLGRWPGAFTLHIHAAHPHCTFTPRPTQCLGALCNRLADRWPDVSARIVDEYHKLK